MDTFAIVNATVVLPDRVLDGGAVLVADGQIADIRGSGGALADRTPNEVDAAGAYLLPGLVDLHNDGLELEVNPRPMANLSLDLAFETFERRLIGAGVTTEFHAIAFMDRTDTVRSVDGASRAGAYVAELGRQADRAVDHQVLHRVEVFEPHNVDVVLASLARFGLRYLSLNDHTPGQGQFRDVDGYLARMRAYRDAGRVPAHDDHEVHELIRARAADTATPTGVYVRVAEAAARLGIVLASHDDDSADKVDQNYALGCRVAEYPVTLDAARRARELGMPIVVGAPNIVRGGSQSGNLSARELFARGLADVITADYHAPCLLPAAFMLVDEGIVDLPTAIRSVTLNPARAVGLTDRGSVEAGVRADLILVRRGRGGVPRVEAAFRGGRQVFSFTPRLPERLAVASAGSPRC